MEKSFLLLISGFAFGLVIGYLGWFAIRPNEKGFTLRTVAAFISTVIGAGVTLAFPTGTDAFAGYSVGLAAGFFFTPIQTSITVIIKKSQEKKIKARVKLEKIEREKIKEVEKDWSSIEKIIDGAVERAILWVRLEDLNNLPYEKQVITMLMKHYAFLHHDRVKFLLSYSSPRLEKRVGYRTKESSS